MVSIKDLDKAAVLAALYNASHPQGMGFLQFEPKPMTVDEARKMLDVGDDTKRMFGGQLNRPLYFDYLKGRVMKVDLSGDEFDPFGYDRDNGSGAAQLAISRLRLSGDVNPVESEVTHKTATVIAAVKLLG